MSILDEYSHIAAKRGEFSPSQSQSNQKYCNRDLFGGQEAPNFDLHHLEGTATDAVHLTRYSNAAVINPNVDKNVDNEAVDKNVHTVIIISDNDQYHGRHAVEVIDKNVDTVSINIKRKLNCPSFSFVS